MTPRTELPGWDMRGSLRPTHPGGRQRREGELAVVPGWTVKEENLGGDRSARDPLDPFGREPPPLEGGPGGCCNCEGVLAYARSRYAERCQEHGGTPIGPTYCRDNGRNMCVCPAKCVGCTETPDYCEGYDFVGPIANCTVYGQECRDREEPGGDPPGGPPGNPFGLPLAVVPQASARNNPIPGCVDNRSAFAVVVCRDDGGGNVVTGTIPSGSVSEGCYPFFGTDWDAVLVRGHWYRIKGTTAIVTDRDVYNCACRLPDLASMPTRGCGRECRAEATPCPKCDGSPEGCP